MVTWRERERCSSRRLRRFVSCPAQLRVASPRRLEAMVCLHPVGCPVLTACLLAPRSRRWARWAAVASSRWAEVLRSSPAGCSTAPRTRRVSLRACYSCSSLGHRSSTCLCQPSRRKHSRCQVRVACVCVFLPPHAPFPGRPDPSLQTPSLHAQKKKRMEKKPNHRRFPPPKLTNFLLMTNSLPLLVNFFPFGCLFFHSF